MDLPDALAWLVGRWEGEGRGAYPNCADFTYRDEITFTHPRPENPVLAFSEHTWLLADGSPSHEEAGYLRATEDGRIELVVAHPLGVVEVHDGAITGHRIELVSLAVACAPTAEPVTQMRRTLEQRDDDTLWYQLDMAANDQPLVFHCEATLHRAG
ncbi:MAG: FABP family protein [Acidimicrobiia bacterium]